jgi:dienelactone hydrolase
MKLRAILLSRHVPTSIGFYPDAEHGFMESHYPGHPNEGAAKLAWNQAIGFLRAAVS